MIVIKNVLIIGLFALTFLNIAFEFYVVKTKLEWVDRYFPDSQMVKAGRNWWGGASYLQRASRLNLYGSIFLSSKVFIWRGLVSQHEIDEVPPTLRLWVMAPLCGHSFVMAGLTLFWIFN